MTDASVSLRATPNPVPYSPDSGSTTLSWEFGTGKTGEIWVTSPDTPARLVASGPSGAKTIDWIQPDVPYKFHLVKSGAGPRAAATLQLSMTPKSFGLSPIKPTTSRLHPVSGGPGRLLKSPIVRATSRQPALAKPFIRAEPNPVPLSPGLGSTTIAWSTGDGSPGAVYLLAQDKQEIPFAGRGSGSQPVAWIARDVVYQFRLYRGDDRTHPIAVTNVTMGNELREKALDYALLASVVILPVMLLTALGRAGIWLAQRARRRAS